MRKQDIAKLRKMLLAMTELEAAAMAMLDAIEQARDAMRAAIEGT